MSKLRKEVLHKHQASHRSKAVEAGVDYDILFNLSMSDDSYEVVSRVSFNLNEVRSLLVEMDGTR